MILDKENGGEIMNTLGTSTSNNYQMMNMYQRHLPSNHVGIPENPTLPVEPKPQYTPEDIYEASDGNLISDGDGNISFTPQGELNIKNAQESAAAEAEAQTQAKKDEFRNTAVDYVAYRSKKSQVEIYLSVATDSDVDLGNDLTDTLEYLRDIQKQNNAVEAYAQYQENQNGEALLV